MKFKFFIVFLLFLLSCKKEKNVENYGLKEILELKNYQIKRTKLNDTIEKIMGQNSDFNIAGNLNTKTKKKDGWWKISNKKIKENFEVEYLDIKPENFNQLKYYRNGKLINEKSVYYEIKNEENIFLINFNFPKERGNQYASLHYFIIDSISKKIIRDEKKDLKNKTVNSYIVEIPLEKNENSILGLINEFTTNKMRNDSMKMEVQTIYFKN